MRFWLGLLPVAIAFGQAPSFRADRVLPSGSARQVKFAPGMLVSIYGENLGPDPSCTGNADTRRTETPNPARPVQNFVERLSYPTELCGVRVTLGGVSAGLLYVSRQQINFKVPQEAPLSGEAELEVVYQERSSAVNVGVGLETTSLSVEGEARVGGPVWIHVQLPYGSGEVRYPAHLQPDDFGCDSLEVRRDGVELPRIRLRPPAGGIANGNPCGQIGIEGSGDPKTGRLPLHLQYRFTEPGVYEVRYSRRRMDFNVHPSTALLSSAWTPIHVLPRAERPAAPRPMPADPIDLLTDYLPSVLGFADRAGLEAVVACLYHANELVRRYAGSALAYWPEDEVNARVDRELAARGPSESTIDGTLKRHPEMLTLVLPYLKSDDRTLLRGAVIGVSRYVSAHPEDSAAGTALIAAAEHVIHIADSQTVVYYAASLGSVRDERAGTLLWDLVRRKIALGQAVIAISWRKDARDLPRLAALMEAESKGDAMWGEFSSLPYALRNSYGDAAAPFLESALTKSEYVWVRTNCARELILLGRASGFAFVAQAIEQKKSYAREMIQYVQERFPQLRGADDAAMLAFLRAR
ncbi:MAG: hypothetical protein JWP63_214 [Candidatus Solibacter sp.]|nr:hypothetical protein [Candidatus Solibacter sp.]